MIQDQLQAKNKMSAVVNDYWVEDLDLTRARNDQRHHSASLVVKDLARDEGGKGPLQVAESGEVVGVQQDRWGMNTSAEFGTGTPSSSGKRKGKSKSMSKDTGGKMMKGTSGGKRKSQGGGQQGFFFMMQEGDDGQGGKMRSSKTGKRASSGDKGKAGTSSRPSSSSQTNKGDKKGAGAGGLGASSRTSKSSKGKKGKGKDGGKGKGKDGSRGSFAENLADAAGDALIDLGGHAVTLGGHAANFVGRVSEAVGDFIERDGHPHQKTVYPARLPVSEMSRSIVAGEIVENADFLEESSDEEKNRRLLPRGEEEHIHANFHRHKEWDDTVGDKVKRKSIQIHSMPADTVAISVRDDQIKPVSSLQVPHFMGEHMIPREDRDQQVLRLQKRLESSQAGMDQAALEAADGADEGRQQSVHEFVTGATSSEESRVL
ncbi:unnamed protein product [Amoebophrya sp. A25]|nr:unnamed protein product [Amoebophrya sp. A25]|eukprot:GSA25T00017214001.1